MDGIAEQPEKVPGLTAISENTDLNNDKQHQQISHEEPTDLQNEKLSDVGESKNKADSLLAEEAEETGGVEQSEQVAEKPSADTAGEKATVLTAAETEGGSASHYQPGEGAADDTTTGADLHSETFKEGEGVGMNPLTGPVSQDGDDYDDEETSPPKLNSGTPKRESCSPTQSEENNYSPTEEEGPAFNYKEHCNVLSELEVEKEKLSQVMVPLQIQLAEYFVKARGDDPRPKKKDVFDQEQRYQKYMGIIAELKQQYQPHVAQPQAEELRRQNQEKLDLVEREWNAVMALKRDVAVAALSRHLGKQAAEAKLEHFQAAELHRKNELVAVRLENIKLKNTTHKLEAGMLANGEVADGQKLIDYEQLKIENQTFSNKIEERNEDLVKLRKNIASTVHVLAHVKEKLQFVQMENRSKRAKLAGVEGEVAKKRELLTKTKQARDRLRVDNLKLRQRCGLLGNVTLLRDFEENVDASDIMEARLESMERRHAELVLKCARLKQKLEHALFMGQ